MAELGIAHGERKNVDQYEGVFARMSDDGNGLRLNQLRDALSKCGIVQSDQECQLLFKSYDKGESGLLTEEEFVDLATSLAGARKTGLYNTLKTKKEYSDAVALIDEREEEIAEVPTIKRKIIRKVEVPYVREVKVPIKTQKIVPMTVKKMIPVKRMVKQEGTKMVEEEYIVIEKQPRKRMKTIYVPKEVEEEYMEDVEITKTRMVEVPDVNFVEIEEMEEVEVTENQLIEVDGFRIDQVEDVKIVEVEEEQEYEFVPRIRGEAHVVARRELGYAKKDHHLTRKFGRIYEAGDIHLKDVENDDLIDHRQRISFHTPDPNNKGRTLYRREEVEGGKNRMEFMHRSQTQRTREVDGRVVYGRVHSDGKWEAGKWIDGRWASGSFNGSEWIYELDGKTYRNADFGDLPRGSSWSTSGSSRTTGGSRTTTTTTTTRITRAGGEETVEETVSASAELVGAAGDDEESESL